MWRGLGLCLWMGRIPWFFFPLGSPLLSSCSRVRAVGWGDGLRLERMIFFRAPRDLRLLSALSSVWGPLISAVREVYFLLSWRVEIAWTFASVRWEYNLIVVPVCMLSSSHCLKFLIYENCEDKINGVTLWDGKGDKWGYLVRWKRGGSLEPDLTGTAFDPYPIHPVTGSRFVLPRKWVGSYLLIEYILLWINHKIDGACVGGVVGRLYTEQLTKLWCPSKL